MKKNWDFNTVKICILKCNILHVKIIEVFSLKKIYYLLEFIYIGFFKHFINLHFLI